MNINELILSEELHLKKLQDLEFISAMFGWILINSFQIKNNSFDPSTTMNYVHLISGSVNKVAQTFSVQPETVASVTTLKVV
jgi:hypothetical protein